MKCSSKEKNTMKMVLGLFAAVSTASLAAGQTLVGALAIDEGRGDQYGWAVDDERARAARQRALSACASGCSVVLTFERCAAYAADQEGGQLGVRVGGVVRLVGRGPATGSVGVRLAWRFGLHGSGVGLQRPGGGGRAGSGPCGASRGSGGPASRGLRPWRS